MVESTRERRLHAPLLMVLWALLAFETTGGLVIFFARLVSGTLPGEALHAAVGVAFTATYALYQWRHWKRVRPFRCQLHHALGLIAASFMALSSASGLWLAAHTWHDRVVAPIAAVRYPAVLSGVHNVASMVVLTFVGAHVGAVLFRDRHRPP